MDCCRPRGCCSPTSTTRSREFRKFFYDGPSVFWKPFAENFFRSAEENVEELDAEQCRLRVEEATLFIEQAQTVYSQM